MILKSIKKNEIQDAVRSNVEQGSELFTDALMSYRQLGTEYVHNFIDHAATYAEGQVHTNGLENFWSLLKRALRGSTLESNRSICSVTLTSKSSVSTTASWTTRAGSCWQQRPCSASASPTTNSSEKP